MGNCETTVILANESRLTTTDRAIEWKGLFVWFKAGHKDTLK